MSLEDEIQDRLVADSESILQNNLDRVEELFQLHSDGTIDISEKYRDVGPENRMLIYLIAQRFAKEGSIADEDTIDSEYFYKRIDRKERTIRDYLQNLREVGLATKKGRSDHRLIVENLPDALDRLEEAVDSTSDSE
ncbi:hypothetical protein [Halorubrum aethiopicum]|uniref:hypothetical protein n=1 Tax=Halorubrum aethiopicum TaxID=1758255 RepID=UPI0008359C30|nr:hypothetical protein [Halorubrum aethiopicum]